MAPLATGSGESLLAIRRSADGELDTRVEVVPVLFALFVSGDDAVTTAEFVSVRPPGALTLTAIDRVAKPGNEIVPRFAVTVPLDPTDGPLQLPWLEEQETNVVPAGSGSLTIAPLAAAGPLLFTMIV